MTYLEKIETFNENNILSLDEVVMWSLELYEDKKLDKFDIKEFKKPLIAASWNAFTTSKIIFWWTNVLFCNETNFNQYINYDIDWLIIMSASWEKHAVVFANIAKQKWIKTKLITCNKKSQLSNIIWKENIIVTYKNREPYTYNTSTYMWWIFAYTWEKAIDIKKFIINNIDPILEKVDFSKYDSYLLVTPNEFFWVNQLFNIKFIELFWRKIARDIFSYEQIKHSATLIPHETELCISFWKWHFYYTWKHIHFPLPQNWDLWSLMAIWYYIIWKIQNSYPQYFKQNIWNYIKEMNKTEFWRSLKIIVE